MPVLKSITIRKKLDSDTLQLGSHAKVFLGQEVEIIIRQVAKPQSPKRNWPSIGNVSLEGRADYKNIRNLAHD